MTINVRDWLKEQEKNLLKFNDIPFNSEGEKQSFIKELTNWLSELVLKNYFIKKSPSKEKVNRIRQNVYWMDFGFNVGTEFNFPHFCVVIKEFRNTAIVVPLSTEKDDDDPELKSAGNLFIPIGVLNDLPGNKSPCYALVNQIRAVSKQRLSDYKQYGKFISITLEADQMQKIFDAISSLTTQTIKEKK